MRLMIHTELNDFFLIFKRLGFFFSDFNYKFDPKYLNLSLDLSIYDSNTKKNPVYLVPEATLEIYEDIPHLHVTFKHYESGRKYRKCLFRFNYSPKT